MKDYEWLRPFLNKPCSDEIWNALLKITNYLLETCISKTCIYYNETVEFIKVLQDVAKRNDYQLIINPTDYIQIGEILL